MIEKVVYPKEDIIETTYYYCWRSRNEGKRRDCNYSQGSK
jgi:hypothetical protein